MAEKDNFLLEWYKRLQFTCNPFEDEVLKPIDEYLVGYVEEKKKLNLFVLEKQPFGMITGEKGFGKTILLKWLQEQLAPHDKRYIAWYLKANDLKTEQDLVRTLVEPLMGGIEKTLTHPDKKLAIENVAAYLAKKIGKKTLFLLVDELVNLPPKYIALFKHLFNGNLNLQLILAGTKTELAETGPIGQKDYLKINLKGINIEEARQFIQKRVERAGGVGIHPFTPTHFQQLYDKSNRNPTLLLKLCREKALQLSLDKEYLHQALQNLADMKRANKPKGFFNIRFMSDEEYAREKTLDETHTDLQLNLESQTEKKQTMEEPLIEEIQEETPEEPPKKEPAKENKPAHIHHSSKPAEALTLKEEAIETKEIEPTEVQYEFEEASPKKEGDVIVTEPSKQPDVVISEDVTEHKEDHKETKHKKHPEKTKEAEETEDFINQLAKEFDKI